MSHRTIYTCEVGITRSKLCEVPGTVSNERLKEYANDVLSWFESQWGTDTSPHSNPLVGEITDSATGELQEVTYYFPMIATNHHDSDGMADEIQIDLFKLMQAKCKEKGWNFEAFSISLSLADSDKADFRWVDINERDLNDLE